jgi:Tannase and feruloyl esterase
MMLQRAAPPQRRTMMRLVVFAASTLMTVITGLGLPPSAAAGQAAHVIQPVRPCADLVGRFDIPAATTHVTAATEVAASAGEPAHCDVRGYIEPAVRFQLRLPTTTYSGRYLQYGCGAYCGEIPPTPFPACGGPRGGDMAVAGTDDGHVGQPPFPFLDGTWAADNQPARDDFFFRAPHVLSKAAKRVIAAYYGAPPRHSYFNGCSNGGREGMLLAQRYPHDFDGIIASAPELFLGPELGMYVPWLVRTNTGPDGAPIITSAKLPVLHNAVVAACDRLDGLVDGQIDDPRLCRFDPAALRCPAGSDQPTCLTPAQVDVARTLYTGPMDRGRRLYPGWETRGSELAWGTFFIGVPFARLDADAYLKYLGYPIGTPHSSVDEIEFTVAEFHRLTPEGRKGNAMGLDLDRFRRSGGKLIIWHGWDDMAIPAAGTLDYYQRLYQRNSGLRETQKWARLFMVPTMYHCLGGYRLNEVDPFPGLVTWVERGQAPDRVIANQREANGEVVRSRPVFPYPLRARYDGSGSIDDARNFVAAAPLVPPHDTVDWVGAYLYHLPGPTAP